MSNLDIEMKDMSPQMETKGKEDANDFSPVTIKVVKGVEVSAPASPVPEPPEDTGTLTGKQVLPDYFE